MTKILLGPSETEIDASQDVLLSLIDRFTIENPDWNPKNRDADESERYIRFIDSSRMTIPTGLVPILENELSSSGIDYEIIGNLESTNVDSCDPECLKGIKLRPYQEEIVNTCLKKGRGVVEAGTGAGKSEIILCIIRSLGTPKTILMVPDTLSMKELYSRFMKRGFSEDEVGKVGDTETDFDKQITICIINSLAVGVKKRKPEVLEHLENCRLFMVDETHHVPCTSYISVASKCMAPFRFGFSGTPYKDDNSRETGILHPTDSWIQGFLGPCVVYLPPRKLQEMEFLCDCEIIPFTTYGDTTFTNHWATVYDRGIVKNVKRNLQISFLAANLFDIGRKVLISIEKLEHGRKIQDLLSEMGIVSACSYGGGDTFVSLEFAEKHGIPYSKIPIYSTVKEGKGIRRKTKKKVTGHEERYVRLDDGVDVREYFESGEINVLIGSRIYDECQDIPILTDLINASGGKAHQRYRQKIGRVLRLHKDKKLAVVWDPKDEFHFYLKNHSNKRIKTAENESYRINDDPFLSSLFSTVRIKYIDLPIKISRRKDMKVDRVEVSVSLSLPLNNGDGNNFVSVKPTISLGATLEPEDDVSKAVETLTNQCRALFVVEAVRQASIADSVVKKGYKETALEYLKKFKKE